MWKKSLIVIIIAGIIWACGGETNKEKVVENSTPSVPAVDGKAVFQKNCVVCHGVNGDMGVNGAFNLQTSKLTAEERVGVITNGRNAMASYKEILSTDEIAAVAQYTTTIGQ
jgi:mono/diheme cytochrome c family protein